MESVTGNNPIISSRNYYSDLIALLFLTLLAGVFFYPVLFDDKVFFFRDIVKYTFPEKHVIASFLNSGSLPFWNPAIFSGTPFLSLLNPSPTYPLNFLLMGEDFIFAFHQFMIVNYLILIYSVYALVRFWGITPPGALAAAIIAAFGGYFLSVFSLGNHFMSAVWTPLILLYFQKFLLGGRTRYFILAVIFLTFQTLGGSVENCILSTLLLYFTSIFLVDDCALIKGWYRRTLAVGGLVFFALGLSAFQLLPTYALIQNSVRDWGLSFEANTMWSLDAQALISLFFPYDLSGFMERTNWNVDSIKNISFFPSVFMGVVPIFFLCTGVVLFKTKEIKFWTVVFFVGIFFALGKYNPFYYYLFQWFPALDMFRYPQKFFFLSAFSLVFITAFWLKAFTASVEEGRYKFKPMLFLTLVVSMALVWVSIWVHWRHAAMTFILIVIVVYLCRLFYQKSLTAVQFKWSVLVIILADLVISNHMVIPLIDRDFYAKEPELANSVGKYEAGVRIYSGPINTKTIPDRSAFPTAPNLLLSHIFEKERLFPKLGMYYGFEYADGSLGVELKDNWLWINMFNKFSPEKRKRMLERSNVKYWVTTENESVNPTSDSPTILRKVKVLEGVLPRAFIVNKVRRDHEAYQNYFNEDINPLEEVLLYESLKLEHKENFEGRVKEISYGQNKVTIHSQQNGEGILVLLDSFFPGWKAKVDGKEEKIMRANYFYRAVKLGSGNHIIEFNYEPIGFRTGLAISLMTLLMLFLCSVGSILIKRNSPALNSPN
ncbi:MAG: YfhO family protein [Nitrospinales bacterium]